MPLNTKAGDLRMSQPPSHQQSRIQRRQAFADTNTASLTGNLRSSSSSPNSYSSNATHPQYQQRKKEDKEKEELRHEYNTPSGNSTPSAEKYQRHHRNNRARHLPLQPQLQPQWNQRSFSLPQRSKAIEGSRVDDGSNVDDDHQHQLHDRVLDTQTRTPIGDRPPKPPYSMKDQDSHYNDSNSCPIAPDDTSSLVSSLSADGSHYYFSNLASVVQNPPPILIICHRRSEIRQRGDEEGGTSESQLRTSPYRIGSGAPHQLAFPGPKKLRKSSPESPVEKENYPRGMVRSRRGKLMNVVRKDLNREEAVVQRHSLNYRQGNNVRSLDQNCPQPHHQRTISTSTQISSYSRIQRHKQMHSTLSYDYKSCGDRNNNSNNSTIQKNRKAVSRHSSMSRLPLSTLSSPPILHIRSKSTPTVLFTKKSLSLSRCGSHMRNEYHSNHLPDRVVGEGSNSITSASYGSMHQSSIIVNGRVVNGITRRRIPSDTVSLVLGGSGGIGGDGQMLHQDLVYKAAIRGVLAELEHSKSFDTQLTNTPSSLESFKQTLNRSQAILVDDAEIKSSGITDSSTNGIVSTSSCKTNQRNRTRRRRRRRLIRKFLIEKMVPAPLRAIKAVLTKKRNHGLERRGGCLT